MESAHVQIWFSIRATNRHFHVWTSYSLIEWTIWKTNQLPLHRHCLCKISQKQHLFNNYLKWHNKIYSFLQKHDFSDNLLSNWSNIHQISIKRHYQAMCILYTTIPLHFPLYAIFNFFPAFAALHLATLKVHMLLCVFPSEPQTGAYSRVHIRWQPEKLTKNQ